MYRPPKADQKPEPLSKLQKQLAKKENRIRKVSKKQSRALAMYRKCRKIHLEENPCCARCGGLATEIHHKKGRLGKLLIDFRYFLSVCHDCHRWITDNSYEAIQYGFSEYRNR